MRKRHGTQRIEGGRHRDLETLDKVAQQVRGTGMDDAAQALTSGRSARVTAAMMASALAVSKGTDS